MNELKMEALRKKKAKDTRGNTNLINAGAVHAMKSMKMKEKELAKLDGMKTLLE